MYGYKRPKTKGRDIQLIIQKKNRHKAIHALKARLRQQRVKK